MVELINGIRQWFRRFYKKDNTPKEIERKWILNWDNLHMFEAYKLFGENGIPIKDGVPYITIKSDGTLVRTEYEFELRNLKIDIPFFLEKTRYYSIYKGNYIEINHFENIEIEGKDLFLIEMELDSEDQKIEIPEWFGKEVTNDKRYYGYNLYKLALNQYNKRKESRK